MNYDFLGSFKVSLFFELGYQSDLGTGWREAFGTFMISRPISQGTDQWKFSIWYSIYDGERFWAWIWARVWARVGHGFGQGLGMVCLIQDIFA